MKIPRHNFVPMLLFLLAGSLYLQEPAYPEGIGVSRALTAEEEAWMSTQPPGAGRSTTAPPTGSVRCAAEYEPMEALLIAWEGTSGQKTVLAKMAAQVTTAGGGRVYCMLDNNSEKSSATSTLSAQGADLSKVEFPIATTDTIWIRDYGPRYIYEGAVRSIIDHKYNRPRANDNRLPSFFSGYKNQAIYDHGLTHGGGNFHLDAIGSGYATRLIANENSGWSEPQIAQVFRDYQNLQQTFFNTLPKSVDSTQHLDMWMQICADNTVVISDWPAQSGSSQDQTCDNAAVTMANLGYTVFRTPARSTGGVHYTYTNVVMFNNLVMIPSFTKNGVSQYNAQAVAAWQQACPGKTIVAINADAVVNYAGVLHCIVMHVPAPLGGVNPTAQLLTPNSGSFAAGDVVPVQWISDDDQAVTSADLDFSSDGGTSWSRVQSGLPAAGSTNWTVPSVNTSQGRLRILVYDASGNSGSDQSDQDFIIGGGNSAASIPYGTGKAGSLGIPALSSAPPILGTTITLDLANGLPGGTAFYLFGPKKDSLPFDGATILVKYKSYTPVGINTQGVATLPGQVPSNASLAGRSFFWQVWIDSDPAASGKGWSCSNGLETRLGY